MKKFVVSFFEENKGVVQKTLQSENQEVALKMFFEHHINSYSRDIEGYQCFLEDFFDKQVPLGKIICLDVQSLG